MTSLTPCSFGTAGVQGEVQRCSPSLGLSTPSPLSGHFESPVLLAHVHRSGSSRCTGPLPIFLTTPRLCTCGSSSCKLGPTMSQSCSLPPLGPKHFGFTYSL